MFWLEGGKGYEDCSKFGVHRPVGVAWNRSIGKVNHSKMRWASFVMKASFLWDKNGPNSYHSNGVIILILPQSGQEISISHMPKKDNVSEWSPDFGKLSALFNIILYLWSVHFSSICIWPIISTMPPSPNPYQSNWALMYKTPNSYQYPGRKTLTPY